MTSSTITRRRLLRFGALAAGAAFVPRFAFGAEPMRLTARQGAARLSGPAGPMTAIWGYGGMVPGPVLRYRQGDRLLVDFRNELAEATSVHWHGLRLPNAMDGVPNLTQAPVEPGGAFRYEFELPDAGTFWYHPHSRSAEQVDRGLAGALIVDEREPPKVDRDLLWVLDDWRLGAEGELVADFDDKQQAMATGRIGPRITINGGPPPPLEGRAGERLRLRLVNAANARIFGLVFEGHRPIVVALDGQPLAPHEPEGGRLVLAPAQRADVILDLAGDPGRRYAIRDEYYAEAAYELAPIVYDAGPPLRASPLDAPMALPANPVPEPDPTQARLQALLFDADHDKAEWRLNGVPGFDHGGAPLFTLKRGETCRLHLHNDSDFEHPIHLHGYAFRVLKRGERPLERPEWRDTVLIGRREAVEIAFVADNPGAWMLHCHILEHQAAGMMGHFEVG
jgi:FtsP/CotA-like multicopper oxidase with cupredoxin domain